MLNVTKGPKTMRFKSGIFIFQAIVFQFGYLGFISQDPSSMNSSRTDELEVQGQVDY